VQNLPCLTEVNQAGNVLRRLVVVHPLWRTDFNLAGSIGISMADVQTRFVDTFDLERRPLRALELAFESAEAPAVQLDDPDRRP
jgi:hypothetical protein